MPRKAKRTGAKRTGAKRRTGRRKMLKGDGFFGDLWSGIKSAVTKPSTWLAGASMIPGNPLAAPLRVAGTVAGLTGNGKRRRRTGRRMRGGRMVGSALSN